MLARLLFPVALAQGLWVRWRTPRLPPARGDHGRLGDGPDELQVVGIGDSIVAGVGVAEQHDALVGQFARKVRERSGRPVAWRTLGFNGATAAEIVEQLGMRPPRADVYLLSAGVNDTTHFVAAERYAANIARLVSAMRRSAPDAVVVFVGIPPLANFPALPWPLGELLGDRARLLQSAAREVLRSEGLLCFDFPDALPGGGFAADGFHPAAEACAEWAGWLVGLWLSRSLPAASPGAGAASPPA
jgi:lysophospholipase L1-like esterase